MCVHLLSIVVSEEAESLSPRLLTVSPLVAGHHPQVHEVGHWPEFVIFSSGGKGEEEARSRAALPVRQGWS